MGQYFYITCIVCSMHFKSSLGGMLYPIQLNALAILLYFIV